MPSNSLSRHLWLLASAVFFIAGIVGIRSLSQPDKPFAAQPQPEATDMRVSTPLPPPSTPEPTPPSSVKQMGDQTWRVQLTNKSAWYDTGIPVIAMCCVVAKPSDQNSNAKWLLKLKGKTFFSRDSSDGGIHFGLQEATEFAGQSIDPDFRDTIKMKLDDESQAATAILLVEVRTNCALSFDFNENDPEHHKFHKAAEAWFAGKKARIARD